jgi:hypothetical protein
MRFLSFICVFAFGLFVAHASSSASNTSMQDYPFVELRTLDKSTARTQILKVRVGDTVQYGSLFIKAQACRESNPLDKPESASFLQIWEVPINSEKSEWIFSGWMFASSPALSAMDHPVYDVWVIECQGNEEEGDNAKIVHSKTVTLKNETKINLVHDDESAVEGINEVVEEVISTETPQSIDNVIESVIDAAISDDVNHE